MLRLKLMDVLTDEQWGAGLRLSELDDHFVVLHPRDSDEIISMFTIHATPETIREAADKYLSKVTV